MNEKMLPFKHMKPKKKYFTVKVCTLDDQFDYKLEV